MAVAFSCKTRVCLSCINRRAEVLSYSLAEKLPEGDYRHLVVTLPKKMGLRKRFQLGARVFLPAATWLVKARVCLKTFQLLSCWRHPPPTSGRLERRPP